MNEMIKTGGAATMSSREIADLVEARHNDVLATIARLFRKGLLRSDRKSRRESTGGRPIDVYDLCQRDTHLVVAGYSDEHRAKVIDRWQELETLVEAPPPPPPSIPQTLAQALRLAADQAEQIEQQQAALAISAPKADALDRIADSSGSMTIREAAKDLGLPPGVFGDWLKSNRWIYRQGKSNLAYEPRITAGLMEHKVTVLELEDEDGTPRTKSVSQPRITPKGLAKLALEVPGARA